MSDYPVMVRTAEAAVLLHLKPAAVRARVGQGELQPVGQTVHGEHLFLLEDVMRAPKNTRE